jgi:hypothetical protein
MSGDVLQRRLGTSAECEAGEWSYKKRFWTGDALLSSISRHQHISLSKQQAAARDSVTLDLASSHPSVDGANLDPAQLRDFALR